MAVFVGTPLFLSLYIFFYCAQHLIRQHPLRSRYYEVLCMLTGQYICKQRIRRALECCRNSCTEGSTWLSLP